MFPLRCSFPRSFPLPSCWSWQVWAYGWPFIHAREPSSLRTTYSRYLCPHRFLQKKKKGTPQLRLWFDFETYIRTMFRSRCDEDSEVRRVGAPRCKLPRPPALTTALASYSNAATPVFFFGTATPDVVSTERIPPSYFYLSQHLYPRDGRLPSPPSL